VLHKTRSLTYLDIPLNDHKHSTKESTQFYVSFQQMKDLMDHRVIQKYFQQRLNQIIWNQRK